MNQNSVVRRIVSRFLSAVLLLAPLGCQTMGQVFTAVDGGLYEAVDTHPVTAQPMVSVVPEEREVGDAQGTVEYRASLVRLLQVQDDQQGRPLLWLQFQNGAQHQVQAIGVTIHYTGEGQMLYQDPSCGGAAVLQTGETKWFSCTLHQIQGATNYNVQVTGVQFR